MIKGGYQIIDLENRNLTSQVGMTYEGIYDKIEGTRKPVLVSGIKISDVEYRDMWVNFSVVGDSFIGVVTNVETSKGTYRLTFRVHSNDVLTVEMV